MEPTGSGVEHDVVDVFRVAPVNAAETLLGKYLAYLVIGGGIAAALTALVVGVLDVPIASSVGEVAIVLGTALAFVVAGAIVSEHDTVADNVADVAGAALALNLSAMAISFAISRSLAR